MSQSLSSRSVTNGVRERESIRPRGGMHEQSGLPLVRCTDCKRANIIELTEKTDANYGRKFFKCPHNLSKELGLVLDKPEAKTHESEIELLLKSRKTTALLMAVSIIIVVFFDVMVAPFSVDTWTPASSVKRHRFLTHAHHDHLAGIASTAAALCIYTSSDTVLIMLCYFPQLNREAFVELEAGTPPLLVSDPDGDFTTPPSMRTTAQVHLLLMSHRCFLPCSPRMPDCLILSAGALMFLFEGAFGAVLHTGDLRLMTDCVHTLPLLPHLSRRIDYIFLNCTFARCTLQFPTKHDSIRQVISSIWKHPNAPVVYLFCDNLGQEDVLFEVSRAFGSKIHIDKDKNPNCHYRLSHITPEILTDDPISRFHIMSFPRLSDRATEILVLVRTRQEPKPLIIRPSSQWYAYCEAPEASVKWRPVLTELMQDEFGVWHVCLSMHSSREELEQALGILRPKWVVSTMPPCIAMDLSYVKKHCCLSHLCPDDPLWKLIGVPDGMTTVTVSPQPSVQIVEAIEESEAAVAYSVDEFGSDYSVQVEVAKPTLEGFEIRVEPPLTLFGRARFGSLPNESQLWRDDYATVELIDDVEIEAMKQATKIGPSKEGMADKSVEVTEITEVSGKIFSKAAEFCMDDNNVKFVKANGKADLAQEHISMRTTA
ncbi:hypothetical protein EJB05_02851, partial [Eragrostis curvula]